MPMPLTSSDTAATLPSSALKTPVTCLRVSSISAWERTAKSSSTSSRSRCRARSTCDALHQPRRVVLLAICRLMPLSCGSPNKEPLAALSGM
ncbi:MAG: hypothetical protein IPN77_04750 [Sandaracinaceae bacterium]|nr:hypothetical protein [Sandaracinaceae bacterium]